MYKQNMLRPTRLEINKQTEGQRLEDKIARMINNGEPLKTMGTQLIYQERKEGVNPAYDMRAEKMDLALDAMNKVQESYKNRSKANIKIVKEDPQGGTDSGKPGSEPGQQATK